jgi:plasmid stability protein
MASITLKGIPEDLRAQLKREAAANFRSISQEAMARIQRTFDLDERLSAPTVDTLIQEALDSGPEEVLTREKFDAARRKAQEAFESKHKAAAPRHSTLNKRRVHAHQRQAQDGILRTL